MLAPAAANKDSIRLRGGGGGKPWVPNEALSEFF